MAEPQTELEQFLSKQSEGGHMDSEGEFSISWSEACRKLGKFELPFDGAWALKLVQAAVASRSCRWIEVTLGQSFQCFEFTKLEGWSLEEIEKSLFEPIPVQQRGVHHLVSALREVGFRERRAFWLGLPDCGQALVWDGEKLSRTKTIKHLKNVSLQITCKALGEDGGFLNYSGWTAGRNRNSVTNQVLRRSAYTCPVPLCVDGNRLDALELDSKNGWGQTSQILALGFLDEELPPFALPRETGGFVMTSHPKHPSIMAATEESRRRPEGRISCSVAFLVSAHVEPVSGGRGRVSWEPRDGRSNCNWVADGVVVESVTAEADPTPCSVGWFISADGLETDLTGLTLRDSPEKQIRLQLSKTLVNKALGELEDSKLTTLPLPETRLPKKTALGLIAAGAGVAMLLSPFYGFLCMGVGWLGLEKDGGGERKLETHLKEGIEKLRQGFDRKSLSS